MSSWSLNDKTKDNLQYNTNDNASLSRLQLLSQPRQSPFCARSRSLSILMKEIHRKIQGEDKENENEDDNDYTSIDSRLALCQKFGLKMSYDEENEINRNGRRIFMGGLISDESWHVLLSNAIENYNIYDYVTFVESNRTQNYHPRPLRFFKETNYEEYNLLTKMFGTKTNLTVVNYVNEDGGRIRPMPREYQMREEILRQWKKLGMHRDDVGFILDPDEVPSKDFLQAIKFCDGTDARGDVWWNTNPTTQRCRSPMVKMSFPMFEGSPICLIGNEHKTPFRWFRPSFVLGACIEGIADSIGGDNQDSDGNNDNGIRPFSKRHIVPPRGPTGMRQNGYGIGNDYSVIDKALRKQKEDDNNNNDTTELLLYPLYNSADFRQMNTFNTFYKGGTGYHLHDFFDSTQKL